MLGGSFVRRKPCTMPQVLKSRRRIEMRFNGVQFIGLAPAVTDSTTLEESVRRASLDREG